MRPIPALRSFLSGYLIALAAVIFLGCRPPGPDVAGDTLAPPRFVDVTSAVGLNFAHDAGPLDEYFMPQTMGSGAALFDFDNDGRLDILLIQSGGPNGGNH